MVDASTFTRTNETYLKASDITGDAKQRQALITAEAVFHDYTSNDPNNPSYTKLNVPVDYQGKQTILSLNRSTTTVLVNSLGADTKDWIGAILLLSVAGGSKPYINVDVLEKPKRGK